MVSIGTPERMRVLNCLVKRISSGVLIAEKKPENPEELAAGEPPGRL